MKATTKTLYTAGDDGSVFLWNLTNVIKNRYLLLKNKNRISEDIVRYLDHHQRIL
jgi:hypothetical protein